MVGLCFSDIGACGSHIVFRLIEALLRGLVAARQDADSGELLFGVGKTRFRLGDFRPRTSRSVRRVRQHIRYCNPRWQPRGQRALARRMSSIPAPTTRFDSHGHRESKWREWKSNGGDLLCRRTMGRKPAQTAQCERQSNENTADEGQV
jgi:hypothetical protein